MNTQRQHQLAVHQQKVTRVRLLNATGQLFWWARKRFLLEPYDGITPKWHLFQDRAPAHRKHKITWVAHCGYTRDFRELRHLEFPKIRPYNNPATTEHLCKRCIAVAVAAHDTVSTT